MLEALLRNYYKATGEEIHSNDVHVEQRQSKYVVFDHELVARKMLEIITPDEISPQWLVAYGELEELIKSLLNNVPARSLNKVVRMFARWEELEGTLSVTDSGGMREKWGKCTGPKVFFRQADLAKSDIIAPGGVPTPADGWPDSDDIPDADGDEEEWDDGSGSGEWQEGDRVA